MAKDNQQQPPFNQIQDRDQTQDQDQRPHLRLNTPRTFGNSRQAEEPDWIDWEGLVRKGIQYHPNHLRRKWKAGTFPKPFKFSARKLVWKTAEVDAWIAAQTEAAE
jgi:hypothetical protein